MCPLSPPAIPGGGTLPGDLQRRLAGGIRLGVPLEPAAHSLDRPAQRLRGVGHFHPLLKRL